MLFRSFVGAQEFLGEFDGNTTIQLLQTSAYCPYVTLDSVKLPNSTVLIINQNMTKSGSTYYSYFNETSLYGLYTYNTYCYNYTAPVDFQVGKTLTIGASLIFLGILVIFIIFLIAGARGISGAINGAWQIFYCCLTYLTLFCIFFLSWLFSTTYLWGTPILGSIFWILWFASAIIFLPFVIAISVYILGKSIDDNLIKG